MTPERVEIARQADHIFISMIREAGLYDKIAQAYAALDPTKAVGVMVRLPFFCLRAYFQAKTQYSNTHRRVTSVSTPRWLFSEPSRPPIVSSFLSQFLGFSEN